MNAISFRRAQLSAAYYFLAPGIGYGLFTARLPALAEQTGATDADIGLALLAVGLGSLAMLVMSAKIVRAIGNGAALKICAVWLGASVVLEGFAASPATLITGAVLFGFGMGLCDAAMNIQGILVERSYEKKALTFMHGAYSFGGISGAVAGSAGAAAGVGLSLNAAAVFILFLMLMPLTFRGLKIEAPRMKAQSSESSAVRSSSSAIPGFIIVCGILSAFAYAAEGAVAEWGGLLLVGEKSASHEEAALVYAVFCTAALFMKLAGDRLRTLWGDFRLLALGSAVAFVGLFTALASDAAAASLAGFGIMGVGLAPIVPILFSCAGAAGDPVRAASFLSSLAYGGMLCFPPMLGFVAHATSVGTALVIVLGLAAAILAGSFILRRRLSSPSS